MRVSLFDKTKSCNPLGQTTSWTFCPNFLPYFEISLTFRIASPLLKSLVHLSPYTEVTAVADYKGWTKISVLNENGKYSYFYLWNEYLTDEKRKEEYLGKFKLTAYCNCSRCCGKWAGGATASGVMPSVGRTVAMGGVPFGTKLMIDGNVYTVEDRGTPYGHVDIYHGSHSDALQFGLRYADVYKVD